MRPHSRRQTLAVLTIVGALTACAPPPPPPPPKPVVIVPATDTVKIPLTDLLANTYFSIVGGIYPEGLNQPPFDHDSAARVRRNSIKPLDVNGDESPFGKYVLISIGGSNTTQVWCSARSSPPCGVWTFMGKAAADPSVNHYTMVVVNGAADSLDATAWTSATAPAYERIKVARLAPLGLSENQVQAAWIDLSDPRPAASLPADSADAYTLLANLGQVMRAMRVRYPNLRLVFVSSRAYSGYASADSSGEPYAYETGFSVKWLIDSQIREVRGQQNNPRPGTLDYTKKISPLILWGPYLWANGVVPRSDGLMWDSGDFEQNGINPSQTGEAKTAGILLEFFKTSAYTRCWFLVNQYCL